MAGSLMRRLVGLTDPPAGVSAGAFADHVTSRREPVIALTAALAAVSGLIHVGAAVDHAHEFPLYTLVFALFAVIQIGWGGLLLSRPSRRILILGASFSLAVIVLWVISRTTGVPIAPKAWVPEELGVADVTVTVDELLAVIAVISVLAPAASQIARRVRSVLPAIMLAALTISVMFGAGAHAG